MCCPAPKEDFIDLEGKVHLATGGQPPLLVRHREAFYAFAADKARGMDGYDQHWAVVDETRKLLAPHFALAADEDRADWQRVRRHCQSTFQH